MPTKWGKELNEKLWRHYQERDIDPNNNDAAYILEKVNTFFPEWYAGLQAGRTGQETAIRRIREKNNVRKIQLEQHREGEEEEGD